MAGLLCVPEIANSQNAAEPSPHVPLQKTIGQGKTKVVPYLIAMNSRGATLKANTLTLVGVGANSIFFPDRSVRSAGHALTADLLEEWAPSNKSKESFTLDPPNATVFAFSKDGSSIRDAVVVLKSPKLDAHSLTFVVDVLEGDLTGADGPASIFMDAHRAAASYTTFLRRRWTSYGAPWGLLCRSRGGRCRCLDHPITIQAIIIHAAIIIRIRAVTNRIQSKASFGI